MTRGRIPVRARKEANPIAEKRGLVQHYQREPGRICDFAIMSPGIVSHVRIKCVRRLCCTVDEMGRELAAEIAAIRIIASSREISRELWLCSPRYAWRFFRVLDQSLTELGRNGMPLPVRVCPGPARHQSGNRGMPPFPDTPYLLHGHYTSVGVYFLPDRRGDHLWSFLKFGSFWRMGGILNESIGSLSDTKTENVRNSKEMDVNSSRNG